MTAADAHARQRLIARTLRRLDEAAAHLRDAGDRHAGVPRALGLALSLTTADMPDAATRLRLTRLREMLSDEQLGECQRAIEHLRGDVRRVQKQQLEPARRRRRPS